MSNEKEIQVRRKFPFLEIYLDGVEILPQSVQGRFLVAVARYGLYHEKPNFDDLPPTEQTMCKFAFKKVWEPLKKGWEISRINAQNGSAGGAPKGNQNARKGPKEKQAKTSE